MGKSSENIKTFESAMEKLEDVVSMLESGNLSLEDSIKEFERAIGLIKLCEEKLEGAKAKVKMLVESPDGSITDVPFDATGCDET